MATRGPQKVPTDQRDTVQSAAESSPDVAGTDTDQSSTIKSGLGGADTAATAATTNGRGSSNSAGVPVSQSRSSREERASDSPAPGTSPPSTITRPPVILSPSDESNSRLREPLLED